MDSTIKGNETASRAKRNMVHFQKRKREIHRLIFLFSFVVLLFVIFYPWSQMRQSGAESLNSLLRRHIETHSEMVSTTLEDTLVVYETASQFLFGLVQLHGAEWILDNYTGFVKTCTAVRDSIELKPPAFLMFVNDTYVKLYFTESNVSVETGKVGLVHDKGLFFHNGTKWRNTVVDGIVYMSVVVSDGVIGVSIFIEVEVIAGIIVPVANEVVGRMVLIDRNSGVMIEDSLGVVEMVGITGLNEPVYPKLTDLGSPFWKAVNDWWIQSGPDKVKSFEIENVEYLFFETVVSPSVADAYCIVTVFPLDDTVARVFYVTSLVQIGTIVLLFLTVIGTLWSVWRIEIHKRRRLVMESFTNDSLLGGRRPFFGVLSRSMQRLRKLQLDFPEDTMLNSVLDSVVSNLSRPRDMLWSVEQTAANGCCGLCRYLIERNSHAEVNVKRAFGVWADMRTETIEAYPELGTLSFPIRRHLQDPIQQLLTLVMTILVKEGLLFSQFDVDGLVQFMKKTASRYCKDNIHTAHLLFTLYYFLNKPFKNWITNKLDLFIIYFSAFVYDTDFTAVFNFDEDDEFSESTEEIWHARSDDNSSDSDSESNNQVNRLRLHISAFADYDSSLSRNVHLTLDLLREFLHKKDGDPVSDVFENTVSDILYSIDNHKQFDLLGEFSVRIESSEFSVTNNWHDRVLFMKALLKVCDFCQCYTLVDGSTEEQERWVQRILLHDQSAARLFHYEHAKFIVSPWLAQFIKFNPLPEVVHNFNKYLNYWSTQK